MKCSPAVGAATAPSSPRIDGLVVDAVALIGGPAAGDIGRQRHGAEIADRLVEGGTREGKAQGDLAALAFRVHLGVEGGQQTGGALAVLAEADAVADLEALGRPHQSAPAIRRLALDQGRLDARHGLAAHPDAGEPRRDHPRVVEDEGVAGTQQVREVANMAVGRRLAWHDDQKPGRIARLGGTQGDELLGQIEVEQIDAHQDVKGAWASRLSRTGRGTRARAPRKRARPHRRPASTRCDRDRAPAPPS